MAVIVAYRRSPVGLGAVGLRGQKIVPTVTIDELCHEVRVASIHSVVHDADDHALAG